MDDFTYKWDGPYFTDADPNRTASELFNIANRTGDLDPKDIIDSAFADKEGELHKLFEWDDEQAAKLHRIQTANLIIDSLRMYKNEATRNK